MQWLALSLLVACGPSTPPKPVDPILTNGSRALKDDAWAHYHSARNAVTIWFPDGHAWKIDDHSARDLVATHPSDSKLTLHLVFDAGELTNREKCETKATNEGFAKLAGIGVVDQDEGIDRNGWDTHIIVGLEPNGVGHVFAFSSSIRKCLWVHFETKTQDENEMLDRLVLVQTKLLAKLAFDSFGEIPRQAAPELRHEPKR